MKFLSRAKQAGPAIGEIVHTLFMGVLGKSYRTLLLNDGIEPTIVDELLYRISIILGCTMLVGLILVVLGLVTAD